MIIISLLACLLFARISSARIKDSESARFQDIVSTQVDLARGTLADLQQTTMQIAGTVAAMPYLVSTQPVYAQRLIDSLTSVAVTNSAVSSVAVIYRRYAQTVYVSGGTTSLSLFCQNHLKGAHGADSLLQTLLALRTAEFTHLEKAGFVYITPFTENSEFSAGWVVYLLDSSALTQDIENAAAGYEHYIQINDEQDRTVLLVNNTSQDLPDPDNYLLIQNALNDHFVYTLGIRSADLLHEARSLWVSLALLFVTLLVVGAAYSFFIAQRIYGPIERLGRSAGADAGKDELRYLTSSISALMRIRADAQTAAEHVRSQLFENLLLHSDIDTLSLNSLLNFTDVHIPFGCFYVACARDKAAFEPAAMAGAQDGFDDIALLHAGKLGERPFMVLNTASGSLERVKAFLRMAAPARMLALSAEKSSLLTLNAAYDEIKFVLCCPSFEPEAPIIAYDELQRSVNNNYVYPKVLEHKLEAAVMNRSAAESAQLCAQITSQLLDAHVSPELCRGVYISLINNLTAALDGAAASNEANLAVKQYVIDIADDPSCMHARFAELVRTFTGLEGIPESGPVQMLREYVDKNFANYDVTLAAAAAYAGMTPSYATKLFREASGHTVKEYIDIKRMDKAKQLLRETELSAADIAAQTGYLDANSFGRKFKQMEGLTPVQYRYMHQKTE